MHVPYKKCTVYFVQDFSRLTLDECKKACASYSGSNADRPCLFITYGPGTCTFNNGRITTDKNETCPECDDDGYCAQKPSHCDPSRDICSTNFKFANATSGVKNRFQIFSIIYPVACGPFIIILGYIKYQRNKKRCSDRENQADVSPAPAQSVIPKPAIQRTVTPVATTVMIPSLDSAEAIPTARDMGIRSQCTQDAGLAPLTNMDADPTAVPVAVAPCLPTTPS